MNDTQTIDTDRFRQVLGHYPTGVVVITGQHPDGEALAMVVGTFTSVSLDPALVAFMPTKAARTFARLRECDSMCINVLTGEQETLCHTIARRRANRLEGIDCFPSPSGDPILRGTLAWLDVRINEVVEAGDHWIVLCRVLDLDVANPALPLIFFQGGYGQFAVRSLVARTTAVTSGAYARAVDGAGRVRETLTRLATALNCESSLLAHLGENELVSVASGVGPGVSGSVQLGELMPAIPPIGDSLLANATPDAQERWLRRAEGASAEELQIFRDRLAFCGAHGYLVNHVPDGVTDPYRVLSDASREYTDGELTPAKERALGERLRSSSVDYRIRELCDTESYSIGSIVVPLCEAETGSQFTLRSSQLPREATGKEVREWVELHHRVAAEIVGQLTETRWHRD